MRHEGGDAHGGPGRVRRRPREVTPEHGGKRGSYPNRRCLLSVADFLAPGCGDG